MLGGACAYGRKPRSPQHGAVSRRCGVVPTRRAGAPPAGPPTPTNHPLYSCGRLADAACARVCMDARGDLAQRVSGGLERLSGGSGWRGYLYTFTSSAPVGSRLAAHARPGPGSRPARSGRRLGHPRTWRASATNARGWRLPPHLHPTGVGRIAARGSRPVRSQPAPRCAASRPSSLPSLTGPGSGRPQCHGTRCRLCRRAASGPSSLLSLTGPGLGRPQCHGTRCRLCRCAASGPSSLLSLTGPWGWVAHKCRDCWSPASGPLSPCPPPGPAGVIVTSTRIRTSGADVQ